MKTRFFVIFFAVTLISTVGTAVANGQVDVARKTTAVTYPLDQVVMVQFRGTTRFPRMKGEARVRRTGRNGTQVELKVSNMPRPFELGAGYATYVLWAISPDGQADNMGEIKRRGFFEFDSKITVTTPLQTFALIVTAEPHFLVRRPSQAIMLENLNPYTLNGKAVSTTTAIQYFGNSSDYFRDPRTPEIAETDYAKTPSAILQAKQAIALAKFAGAERDAAPELNEAEVLYQNAEAGWKAGRRDEQVDIDARKAVSAAVKAETTAGLHKAAREKRNEKIRADAESRQAEEKISDAQGQIADLRSQLAQEMRNRELAERDVLNISNQNKDLRAENSRISEELGRAKLENESYKTKLAAAEAEKQNAENERDKQTKIAQIRAAEDGLITSLRKYGQVSRIDKSIVLVLPESLWAGARSSALGAQSATKITSLGELLAANPDYMVTIESHTDNSGAQEAVQAVTDARAQLLSDKFKTLGIGEGRLRAKGFGASIPASPNTTAANRAKNRRVNIILDLMLQ
jgi:outer membrane protein OmpA-like peptidoglycan-associated protein